MKTALQAANVDTSDCFERRDLESKFSILSIEQQSMGTCRGEPSETNTGEQNETTNRSNHESTTSSPQEKKSFIRFLKSKFEVLSHGPKAAWKKFENEFTSGNMIYQIQVKLDSLANKLKISEGLNQISGTIRENLEKVDQKTGFSRFVKNKAPAILSKTGEFRQTTFGSVVFNIAALWFFFSGTFWTCLKLCFPVVLLSNWIYPNAINNLFASGTQDFLYEAQRRAQEQQMGGGFTGQTKADKRESKYSEGAIDVEAEVRDK
eukprot:CAMPEP_0196588292 /NCGR_PEP_ID=MMETSP1081-20130531/60169_1 /TAXON_ID=36882 /ORGANISM="Pyramimonas amylifera, Strain CCMP720" /LENGTH=262 /DNA_ID=CAMNT_0041910751 /DNA_START=554 /DNA_END=1342 /DNA_ORIENTATION=+